MMKILLLSDLGSPHTLKWARALSQREIRVLVIGLYDLADTDFVKKSDYEQANVEIAAGRKSANLVGSGLNYARVFLLLRRKIAEFRPDIVHAHYATSYGLLGRLSRFSPLIISLWGSDVYEFPKKSIIHRKILKRNLASAFMILSTSKVMAMEVKQYIDHVTDVRVTPFGVDIGKFQALPTPRPSKAPIVIGTIKVLAWNYGIDILIEAFHLLARQHPDIPLRLLIGGTGPEESKLRERCQSKGLSKRVEFIGRIDHSDVPNVLKSIDIFAALSRNESFGVAVIEASASGLPVVVSDAPGLAEVVEANVTGIVVKREDVQATFQALERLVLNEELRRRFGAAGRARVMQLYDWEANVDTMCDIYDEITRTTLIARSPTT